MLRKKKARSSGSTCAWEGKESCSSRTYPQRLAAAAVSCRSSKQQQAPTGESAVYPALLDTRCAINAAKTGRSPSFFFVVLFVRQGVVAAKVKRVVARVQALAAAAAAFFFQQCFLLAAALGCDSAWLPQRFQQQHCSSTLAAAAHYIQEQ